MKKEFADEFVNHLVRLKNSDRGAMAALRHSLAFPPGDYPKAYPYVEHWVGADCDPRAAMRLALYAVAGFFAAHPEIHERSLAGALGKLLADKKRPSLELRFRALLEADGEGLLQHLRQAVSLLASETLGFNHSALLRDLCILLDGRVPELRDDVRRRWARQFYGALSSTADAAVSSDSASQPT
ncbi:CRISPR system Cascade subunit CasB [Roseateles asaccharophilus]|uniref:type I-E CRISPR-associated protein Cse2/CasB n=1 Tax=Roseateles asaccharophilus TaxID=582607 RepID=UPI003836A077